MRFLKRELVVVLTVLLMPIGGKAWAAETREWVVTSAERVGDLYWNGELTDSRGDRWEVDIVPGVRPPVIDGWKAWASTCIRKSLAEARCTTSTLAAHMCGSRRTLRSTLNSSPRS